MKSFNIFRNAFKKFPQVLSKAKYMMIPCLMYNIYTCKKYVQATLGPLDSSNKEYYPQIPKDKLQEFLSKNPNIMVIPEERIGVLISRLRDVNTNSTEFRRISDRVIRLLIEEYLSHEPKKLTCHESPVGLYDSVELQYNESDYCVVSILRSGSSVLNEMLNIIPGITIGKILLQRNESHEPVFYYQKYPQHIETKRIIVFDPMLATGGSIIKTIENLIQFGCKPTNITFINIVSCVEGLERLVQMYPDLKIITAAIDPVLLPESKYIAPGLGDFGDRYYGTEIS